MVAAVLGSPDRYSDTQLRPQPSPELGPFLLGTEKSRQPSLPVCRRCRVQVPLIRRNVIGLDRARHSWLHQ
jgi:hypothetical protein